MDIGTYPKLPDNQPLSIVNYDDDRRRPVADGSLMAWGELTYYNTGTAKGFTIKQRIKTGRTGRANGYFKIGSWQL